MKIDSLNELKRAFVEWRRKKKHAREPMPEELRARARRAAEKYGVTAVVRVTGVEKSRLFRAGAAGRKAPPGAASLKADVASSYSGFSRLELSAPGARPVAEVEMGSGATLRVFEHHPEMMKLLLAVCGHGGV